MYTKASDGKESACNAEGLGLTPGLEDPLEKGLATRSSILARENSSGEGTGYPLQYSCL